jgi:hypothetical protein
MIDAADAKELIDESIERAEAEHEAVDKRERAVERRFRDRVSIMVGVLAVALAIIHMSAAGAARESLLITGAHWSGPRFFGVKAGRATIGPAAASASRREAAAAIAAAAQVAAVAS